MLTESTESPMAVAQAFPTSAAGSVAPVAQAFRLPAAGALEAEKVCCMHHDCILNDAVIEGYRSLPSCCAG
jgi:hypothetical protein